MDKKTAHIVLIGHLDHGKSTLIGRLLLDTHSLPKGRLREIREAARALGKKTELAFLVDQLKEERQLERSIETTQANVRTKKRNYVLIDAPGHTEFITRMLTGASMADTALLIIDAREGIKEQTQRHAYLIKLLGIDTVIVVLNKMDLAQYQKKRFEIIKTELSQFLRDLHITPLSFIPLSAAAGENISRSSLRMKWYKGPFLLQALNKLSLDSTKQTKPLRFCVQDMYQLPKETIAVGKVVSGTIYNGQRVTVLPLLKRTKVTLIKVDDGNRKKASAGENIGLRLEDAQGLQRGQIIAAEDNFSMPVRSFKSTVFWISAAPLRINRPFTLRLMTQEVECVAEKIENIIDPTTLKVVKRVASELGRNQAATIIFKTKEPLMVEDFSFIDELGRFVIERENRLQGVGTVSAL